MLRFDTNRALWAERPVDLTLTEFKIVTLLAEKAGRDVGYREIYDLVHSKDFVTGQGSEGYRANVRTFKSVSARSSVMSTPASTISKTTPVSDTSGPRKTETVPRSSWTSSLSAKIVFLPSSWSWFQSFSTSNSGGPTRKARCSCSRRCGPGYHHQSLALSMIRPAPWRR
jgi:hypothetical protein